MLKLLVVCVALVAFAGCQKKDDSRIDISGKVTWKGQPVPTGQLFFSPDVSKGNSGAQGMAEIKNGQFDTRFDKGRPTVLGAITVTVHGFDGVGTPEDGASGKRMFMPYEMAIEVSPDSEELELVVPESVKAL